MFRHTKEGNLAVEASIILPILIIGILTIGYLIKINSTNDNVMSICIDEARQLNIQSYTIAGKAEAIGFPKKLEKRLQEENTDSESFDISNFKYLYTSKGIKNLISFEVRYKIGSNFPLNFSEEIVGREKILTRAFVGSNQYSQSKGFEKMEEEEESELVWIFPMWGKKYHKEECTYIRTSAAKVMLNSNIRKKYKPCKLCKSQMLKNGEYVYCFFYSGNSYHTGFCSTVEKYVIKIEKSEAQRKGYESCIKCGAV